jgi:hypothetical protein
MHENVSTTMGGLHGDLEQAFEAFDNHTVRIIGQLQTLSFQQEIEQKQRLNDALTSIHTSIEAMRRQMLESSAQKRATKVRETSVADESESDDTTSTRVGHAVRTDAAPTSLEEASASG